MGLDAWGLTVHTQYWHYSVDMHILTVCLVCVIVGCLVAGVIVGQLFCLLGVCGQMLGGLVSWVVGAWRGLQKVDIENCGTH